ncbi:MAG: alpha/beta hydrolase [Chitinophagaceae bacterium]|nr:MAG: alpha/beta hydrolase [Chitinophagaceae bacterium]
MDVLHRNNVTVSGEGDRVLLFAHGFGCDKNMWRYVTPAFEKGYKVVTFDHVGAGGSLLSHYTKAKYDTLDGYASDILDIIHELGLQDVTFVGHSVSAMMGVIAAVREPALFRQLVLVSPSPSYINDGDYVGGFTRPQINELLESMDNNHLGWSMAMAPVIMGNPDRQDLVGELANSFCRTDPDIARHFARTTFLTDERAILHRLERPALILQCSNDIIAPVEVGHYMQENMAHSTLVILEATGHCPNLSAPEETIHEIKKYLARE